jgi:Na+/glutamate symporter
VDSVGAPNPYHAGPVSSISIALFIQYGVLCTVFVSYCIWFCFAVLLSPYHSAAVMGGMWGGMRGALPNLLEELEQWEDK